ncbi:MAG TPA: hypothetical protein VF008_07675 [Niastella sp.]
MLQTAATIKQLLTDQLKNMYVQNQMPKTAFLLADLAVNIREHQDPVDRYLQRSGAYEVFNPFQDTDEASSLQKDASLADTFWEGLGIRHVISNSHTASQLHWPIAADAGSYRWNNLKNNGYIEKLRTYISNCSIIAFADYANVADATDIWDGFFEDVIKPLNKRDFEFIFRLGDITRRLVFELDEILDIIGDYSSHGRVSLVLDEQEADKLWNTLYGASYGATRSPDVRGKYLALFNAMRIDVLLILCSNRVLLFSRDGQLEFAARPMNNIHVPPQTIDCFHAGFRLGLLLHLDIPHAIVLAQAISGACLANAAIPMSRELLAYIDEWMSIYS